MHTNVQVFVCIYDALSAALRKPKITQVHMT